MNRGSSEKASDDLLESFEGFGRKIENVGCWNDDEIKWSWPVFLLVLVRPTNDKRKNGAVCFEIQK